MYFAKFLDLCFLILEDKHKILSMIQHNKASVPLIRK